jgi:putative molybdopterin biosynthesis protein
MRNIYLNQIPRTEALAQFLNQADFDRKTEIISVKQALGRVTAEPVFARRSIPAYPTAAMDGITVRAQQTFAANDQNPVLLNQGGAFLFVDTGDPIPEGFDAVIKIEDLNLLDDTKIEIISPAAPWQHIRPVGEDIVAGEIILSAYHRLEPPDLGALLAGGIAEIAVLVKPKVMIIPTGDEIVAPEQELKKGDIPEFNSAVLAGYLTQWGAEFQINPVVRDDPQELKVVILKALNDYDFIIVNAGSSAGSEDFTGKVIQELGEVYSHGLATKPGKPTILGKINRKPVIGLPGYPISAYLSLEWFVKPLLYKYWGRSEPKRQIITATLGRRIVSELGVEEFVRVTLGYIHGNFVANPLGRGAGIIMSMVRAHGLLVVPANSLGYEQDEEVDIQLYRELEDLKKTIVAAGSHDLVLDMLDAGLKRVDPELAVSSAHLGSMGGINAILHDQAHMAGIHLFDSGAAEYNIPYIKRYLPEKPVVLVNLVYRTQGLMVKPGNPLRIEKVSDLLKKEVRFVNRQRGSGTRILFDDLLQKEGIAASQIYGYEREEFTHLNVASAIVADTADVGVGILAAARAYGLDFVPLTEERYDLLLTKDFYESPPGKALMEVIHSLEFKQEVEKLGGYNLKSTGKVLYQ